jgi:hypothetical protein
MDLSQAEWQRVVDAMWAMKNLSMEEGQARFGASFKTHDYFVVKHAVAAADSRGDQAHNSDASPTFHAAFVLEFENTLLAIDPSIGALPYWSTTNGEIFTETHMGSALGTGEGHTVVDGKFARWSVPDNFNMAEWSPYLHPVPNASNGFHGSFPGFLRDLRNNLNMSYVTRSGTTYVVKSENFNGCIATSACFPDWYRCIDGHGSFGDLQHRTIGGMLGNAPRPSVPGTAGSGPPRPRPAGLRGNSGYSSPDDPIFYLHHANVDRSRILWMQAHAEEASVFYGYGGAVDRCPVSSDHCPSGGIALGDVITAQFPFTSSQLGLTALESDGLTHADVLCNLSPAAAPYTYAAPGAMATPAPLGGSSSIVLP